MNQPDFVRKVGRRFQDLRFWIAEKVWYAKTQGGTFAKRFKLFVVLCVAFIAVSKILYLSGVTVPNLELIIPALVVVGAFAMHTGSSEKWSKLNEYFGIIALVSVFIIDTLVWGLRPIYLFTWPAFIGVWYLAKRKDLSFMDKFSDIAFEATLTAAFLIIAYDVFTAFGTWLLWGGFSMGSLLGVYLGQITFTLYHLGSLFFVPPLVALGKRMTRVKIRASVPIKRKIRRRVRR